MRKKIKFTKLLSYWFTIALSLSLINGLWIKIPIIQNLILASIGIILLVYPVMPYNLQEQYGEKKGKLIIRLIATIEIIVALFLCKF